VAIFLTETNTRHSLLHKRKHFRDKTQTKLKSNSTKLTGETSDEPIDVDAVLLDTDGYDVAPLPVVFREESDDSGEVMLADIPSVDQTEQRGTRAKRRRVIADSGGDDDDDDVEEIGSDGSDEAWAPERHGVGAGDEDEAEEAEAAPQDDKKKLAMDISYEGFAIYGRVLCLVVKRRDRYHGRPGVGSMASTTSGSAQSQPGIAMMEDWITSTQLPGGNEAADEDLEA
jgi:hypothetical protein